MQGMESDATAIRVVYRTGKQVVYIDEHCRDHQEVGQLPVFPEEKAS